MRQFGLALATTCFAVAVLGAQEQAASPAPPAGAQEADAQQRPLFRGGARFVRVDVYPTGADGRPVEGLTAEDFTLLEDGKPQVIDTFEFVDIVPDLEDARLDPNTQAEGDAMARDPRARVFVVVLDTKHVDVTGGARIRRPLTDMLDRLIGPRDVFGVITPQLRPSDLMLGRKTITAADMLERHWAWGTAGSVARRDVFQDLFEGCYGSAETPLVRELIARARERQTLAHLDGLVGRLGGIRDEKKAIIVVTQGWTQFGRNDTAANNLAAPVPGIYTGGGRIGTTNRTAAPGQQMDASQCASEATRLLTMDTRQDFRSLYEKARRANVSFYPIDPRGLAVFDESIATARGSVTNDFQNLRTKRDGMTEIAINTDGVALMYSNDLSGELGKLADSLSTYYLLGYYSANTNADGGYRKIEVKVRKPDVKLKARRGYFAPTEEEIMGAARARGAEAAPVSAEAAAVSTALGRLDHVRHDRDLFIQAARVPGRVVVSAELGVNARSSASWAKGGEVRLMISSGADSVVETRAIAPMQSGVVVSVPMPSGGDVRIDARARPAGEGAIGAADATATVPPAVASLIGEALSFRGLARALTPAADGRYRRTERATIEAALAEGAVPAGARLLDRAGKPLAVPAMARERVDAAGTRWMAAEVILGPLTEGDYLVELEVMKNEMREKRLFAIRVVR
ncbi:MAG: VWA domain-containing protein [Acidobacteriota bacterium]|nr:VWA domain-containing protein [Acidobacteriota bacterium]